MTFHRFRSCGLVAALVSALAAPLTAVAQGSTGSTPITFHAVVAATGPGAFYGTAARQGTDLAVEEINARGGIKGRPIRIEYLDDATNPAEAANIARRFATDAQLLILDTITSVSSVILPIANSMSMPAIGPMVAVPKLVRENRPYTFSFFPDMAQGADMMIATWMATEKVKNVVVIEDRGDVSSKTQSDLAQQLIKKHAGTVVEVINVPTGTVSFAPVISRLRSLAPDGIFVSMLSSDSGGLLSEVGKAGLKQPRAMSIASYTPAAIKAAGAGAEGVYSYLYYLASTDAGGEAAAFEAAFKKKFGSAPIMQSALAYQMMTVVGRQLDNVDLSSGSLQERRERIRTAIAAIRESRGPLGSVTMEPDGVVRIAPILISIKAGKEVRVQ
jgi:branched-chain amino acid transport system substrate-binding protein